MKNITAKIVAIALVAMLLVPVVGGTAVVWAKTEDELVKALNELVDKKKIEPGDIETIEGYDNINVEYDTDNSTFTVTYSGDATAAEADADKFYKEASKLKSGGSGEGKTVEDAIGKISGTVAIEANMDEGAGLISKDAQELIAKFLGGLTIAILTLVGVFTAIDIFYLVVPPLHTALEEGAAAKGQTDKNGNPKPRLVSKDACDAYNEGTENQKNVILTYLKKRIVAYIAVAVVVFLLLTGQMSAIITTVLKLISGVLESVFGG